MRFFKKGEEGHDEGETNVMVDENKKKERKEEDMRTDNSVVVLQLCVLIISTRAHTPTVDPVHKHFA